MDEILARLERIERRLDALEAGPTQPAPPPIVWPPADQVSPSPFSLGRERSEDLETTLGARWLPRAGALAVIAAIAYLVGLGLQRGVITPATVALGIAVVCAGVALLGARMRDARETFGNVLVGLAAGGLYVDAVGANLYREILSGEAMVAACVTISLLTLGFGARRGLPSFLGIGLFGGLVAAAMPLSKGLGPTPVILFGLVALPAFAIAARRGWAVEAMAVWAACYVASLGCLLSPGPLALRLLPLDAALLMGVVAWALATEKPPALDPPGTFPFVAVVVSGLTSFSAWNGAGGTTHIAGLGLAIAALGFFLRHRETGRLVGWAGLVLTLVIAPLGLHFYRIPAALAALSLTEAIGLWILGRHRWQGLRALIALQSALANGIYGALLLLEWSAGDIHLSRFDEQGLIGLLTTSAIATGLIWDRREARIAAGAVLWGLATRFAVIGTDLPPGMAVTSVWLVLLMVYLAFGFRLRKPELRQLGLVIAAATVGKVALVDLAGVDAAVKAALLMGLGIVLLGGGYAYVRWAAGAKSEEDGTRETGTVSPPGR